MDNLMLETQQIAFIGAGSMSEALLRGIVDAGLVNNQSVVVMNRSNRGRLDELRSKYGVRIPLTYEASERLSLVRRADIVVLAMKPKDVGSTLAEFRDSFREGQLIVSVVAGLSIETIEHLAGGPRPVVRTMPNTSSTIGLGATGLSCSASVTPLQKQMAMRMFEAVGLVISTEEEKLNLVTGVSGSGPAYVYYLMESMIAAGVEGGLHEEDARSLVVQTVLGAAQMVRSTGIDPSALRAKVTSPNGTTHAAISIMEQYGVRASIMMAIDRATERAQEMGDEIGAAALQSAADSK